MADNVSSLPTVDSSRLLARDYWLISWIPRSSTSAADIQTHLEAHLRWLLEVERSGVLLLSGPLLSGPRVAPGSGVTVLRSETIDEACVVAASDPFVLHGLRTFELMRWRVNEGSIAVELSLGTGTYRWL